MHSLHFHTYSFSIMYLPNSMQLCEFYLGINREEIIKFSKRTGDNTI